MGFQCQCYEKSHSSNSSAKQTIQILSGKDDHHDVHYDDNDHDGNDDDDEISLNKQLGKVNHANIVRLAMVMVMVMLLVVVMVMGLLLMNQSMDPISHEAFLEYILEHGLEFENVPNGKIFNRISSPKVQSFTLGRHRSILSLEIKDDRI